LLYQVLSDIGLGRLVTVLDGFAPDPLPIHVVLATKQLLPARVRSFVDLAVAEARWQFGLDEIGQLFPGSVGRQRPALSSIPENRTLRGR
jgi:hypothetical protein